MMLPVIVSRPAPTATYQRGLVKEWELELCIGSVRSDGARCLLPAAYCVTH